jgi:hypothetical protein
MRCVGRSYLIGIMIRRRLIKMARVSSSSMLVFWFKKGLDEISCSWIGELCGIQIL